MEALVDALARDGYAAIGVLDGRELDAEVRRAAELLATVLGQDLDPTDGGGFRIARRVAPDRVISTVDPQARHGHKTSARGFDGYKGHVSIDPDSEIIVGTAVTAANVSDAQPAPAWIEEAAASAKESGESAEVFGDSAYGTAEMLERLEETGVEANVKVQAPSPPRIGLFSQDAFEIDTTTETVRCPAAVLVPIHRQKDGSGVAVFGKACTDCAMRHQCTTSPKGRTVRLHPKHDTLAHARRGQRDPEWKARYRATRPKVERKIAHLMRRKHGGRRARVRGQVRVGHDFALLAAAVNLARLAALGVAPPAAA